MTLSQRPPLHLAGAEAVNRRVAYQYVRLKLKHRPLDAPIHPPTYVLYLAENLRDHGLGYLYWSLRWYATNLAHGFTMAELRDLGPDGACRALHKRRPRRPA